MKYRLKEGKELPGIYEDYLLELNEKTNMYNFYDSKNHIWVLSMIHSYPEQFVTDHKDWFEPIEETKVDPIYNIFKNAVQQITAVGEPLLIEIYDNVRKRFKEEDIIVCKNEVMKVEEKEELEFDVKLNRKIIECSNDIEEVRECGMDSIDCNHHLLSILWSIYRLTKQIYPEKEIVNSINRKLKKLLESGRITP